MGSLFRWLFREKLVTGVSCADFRTLVPPSGWVRIVCIDSDPDPDRFLSSALNLSRTGGQFRTGHAGGHAVQTVRSDRGPVRGDLIGGGCGTRDAQPIIHGRKCAFHGRKSQQKCVFRWYHEPIERKYIEPIDPGFTGSRVHHMKGRKEQ